MLINGIDLLDVANKNNFAVPAFNISDYAMMNGLFEISEEKDSPLIVAIHPDELSHIGADMLPAIIARAHRSTVPVTIHLDHGATYEQVLPAIQGGFTSVMIDGSLLPFEENVAITKKVVDAAHAVGVSVEGELGTIGKTDDDAEAGAETIIYTDPDDAVKFVEATGVDSLAIAIGTCHGLYPAGHEARTEARPAQADQGQGQHPAGAARRIEQPGRRDRQVSVARHQQDQHLQRHQGPPTTTRCARSSPMTPLCASPTPSSRRASRP